MLETLNAVKWLPGGRGGTACGHTWLPGQIEPKNAFLNWAVLLKLIQKKNGYENQFLSWQNAPLQSLGEGGYGLQPPVDRPLANLAMGNMCFFMLRGLYKLLKITTKRLPGQVEPQKCIFE